VKMVSISAAAIVKGLVIAESSSAVTKDG